MNSGNSTVLSYQGAGNANRQVTINYTSMSNVVDGSGIQGFQQMFPQFYVNMGGSYNPSVPATLVLPDQTEYKFTYNSYREVSGITLPTGGKITYQYPNSVGNDCTTACALFTSDGNGYSSGGAIIRRLLGAVSC